MPSIANRVSETSSSTGTTDFILLGAALGFNTFNLEFGLNNRFWYFIIAGSEVEEGSGYLSDATTLVRETVYRSSNANALVNFSSGTKSVFCSIPAIALKSASRGRTTATARGMDMA